MTPTPGRTRSLAGASTARSISKDPAPANLASDIDAPRETREICSRALEIAHARLRADRADLYLLESDRRVLGHHLTLGLQDEAVVVRPGSPGNGLSLSGNHGAAARAIHTRRVQAMEQGEAAATGDARGLAVPLVVWGEALGVILLRWGAEGSVVEGVEP